MATSKAKTQIVPKARSAKPRRKVAEAKSDSAARKGAPTLLASETHMEFYITLPKEADVEKFVDALTDLVENAGGSVGGGTVVPEA